jgi:acyl-coenzyme A synthetase/AMP-(fatty) acid ligase
VTPVHAAPEGAAAASPNALAASLLAAPDRTFAWHGGRAITAATFLAHARRLAATWAPDVRVVNVCEQRYHFLVGFAAAMLRGGATILPPSRAPAVIDEMLRAHAGAVSCDDPDVAAAIDAACADERGGAVDLPLGPIAAIGHTSGSTGAPQAHPKTWAAFVQTAERDAARIREAVAEAAADANDPALAARAPSIVATVPSQHMYGMELTVMVPLACGAAVHGGRPMFAAEVAAALAEVPAPRVLVTTPAHLKITLDALTPDDAWPSLAAIVSATAPLDPALAAAAECRLGTRLVEMFGATETFVFAARRTAQTEWWMPQEDVVVEHVDDGTRVHTPWLAEPRVIQDVVELAGPRFRVIGRNADLIDVAGKRASLADLTRKLCAVPGVVDAVAFQPDRAGSSSVRRVAALVVAPTLDAETIRRELAQHVDPVFLPRPLVFVDALPRNEVGKLPRERLLAALERATRAR